MAVGYSFPYFVRAEHFRLGELSGRSQVVYGQLMGQETNGRSSVAEGLENTFILTNGRSYVSQQFTEFVIDSSRGPSHWRPSTVDGFAQFNSSIGPSQFRPPNNQSSLQGVGNISIGPSVGISGDFELIKLINRFGFRSDLGGIRAWQYPQTMPEPDEVEIIFTPEILKNDAFAVWLDGASAETGLLTLDTDDTVISWRNKAPSGTTWSALDGVSAQPLFVESAKNGLGGLQFNGTANTLKNEDLLLASSSGEIFIVYSTDVLPVPANYDNLWSASTKSVGNKYFVIRPYEPGGGVEGPSVLANNTAGEKRNIYDAPITSNNVYILCCRSLGQGIPWEVDVNGSGLTGTTVSAAAHEGVWHGAVGGIDTMNIGSLSFNNITTQYFDGVIHEIVAYEAQLEGAQRSGILDYLADKWNIPLSGAF